MSTDRETSERSQDDASRPSPGRPPFVTEPSTLTGPTQGASTHRARRRQQLITAARQAFHDHGYHETSMAAVSARAQVAKPVLYQHFSNKLDLYLAVVQQHLDTIAATLRQALRPTATEFDNIRAAIGVFYDIIDSGEDGAHELVFVRTVPSEPAVEWRVRTATTGFADTIAEHIRSEHDRPDRARLAAYALLGAALSAARQWRRTGRITPKSQALDTTAQWYQAGLRSFATNVER